VDDAEAMPLAGKRVWITRAAEQSQELIDALKKRGAKPVVFPLVEIIPPEDFSPLDAALRKITGFDWVLFTSRNAVKAVRDRAGKLLELVTKDCAGLKVAAVGEATANEARSAGFEVAHIASRSQAVALVQELGEALRGKRIFLPRSDRADPDLVKLIKGLGGNVCEVVAYRTITVGKREGAEHAEVLQSDAVVLFSPSAVAGFLEIFSAYELRRISEHGVVAAIGPVTNAALQTAGIRNTIVAEEASVAGIIEALANFFRQREHAASARTKQA